jgi:ribosomal protein L7/L12
MATCDRCSTQMAAGEGYAVYSEARTGISASAKMFFSTEGSSGKEVGAMLLCESCANGLFTEKVWADARKTTIELDQTTARGPRSHEAMKQALSQVNDFSVAMLAKRRGLDVAEARQEAREIAQLSWKDPQAAEQQLQEQLTAPRVDTKPVVQKKRSGFLGRLFGRVEGAKSEPSKVAGSDSESRKISETIRQMSSKTETGLGIKVEFVGLEDQTVKLRVNEAASGFKFKGEKGWTMLTPDEKRFVIERATSAAFGGVLKREVEVVSKLQELPPPSVVAMGVVAGLLRGYTDILESGRMPQKHKAEEPIADHIVRAPRPDESVKAGTWRLKITGCSDRIAAMKDLRSLLSITLVEAKEIIDNLPYLLVETTDWIDVLTWRSRLESCHFEVDEELVEHRS